MSVILSTRSPQGQNVTVLPIATGLTHTRTATPQSRFATGILLPQAAQYYTLQSVTILVRFSHWPYWLASLITEFAHIFFIFTAITQYTIIPHNTYTFIANTTNTQYWPLY